MQKSEVETSGGKDGGDTDPKEEVADITGIEEVGGGDLEGDF